MKELEALRTASRRKVSKLEELCKFINDEKNDVAKGHESTENEVVSKLHLAWEWICMSEEDE
eukprot:7710973-Ditylum_brightwellii.AAC.1